MAKPFFEQVDDVFYAGGANNHGCWLFAQLIDAL
jgi:hypothetical protein